jgi:NADPH2:quinone reductase
MRALLCRKFGPPQSLVIEDIEPPHPRPDEVRIDVGACGVNFPDILMLEGKYQFRPEMPFSPGLEAAGTITKLGDQVDGWQVGDHVIAKIDYNGYQEQTVVPARACLALPSSMDLETGAAFPITYGTSYHALVDRANLRPGETLLVLGATGGVGTAAIDIARNLGSRIIAAGGSDEKLERVRQLYGVDETINYRTLDEPFKDRVNELTDGRGADVIYDPVGGDLFQQCLRCVNWNGRILVVGFAADGDNLPQARTNLLLLKGSSLIGVFWGRFTEENPQQSKNNFKALFDLHARGKLEPHISHRFALADGARALQAILDREVVGKCVLTMG